MAKKAKKRASKPKTYMMVLRVAVPAKVVPFVKARTVIGRNEKTGYLYSLEILNAYYDKAGQPDAMPDIQ